MQIETNSYVQKFGRRRMYKMRHLCWVTYANDLVFSSQLIPFVADCDTSVIGLPQYPECIPCICSVSEELHRINADIVDGIFDLADYANKEHVLDDDC